VPHINFSQKVSENSKYITRSLLLSRNRVDIELRQIKPQKAFQINQPTRCNNFLSLLLEIYVQLNIFRASSRPSSGAQQLQ